MLKAFQRLMPKEERFFDMFARQAETMIDGADAMLEMFTGETPTAEWCQAVGTHEDRADDITREVLLAVR